MSMIRSGDEATDQFCGSRKPRQEAGDAPSALLGGDGKRCAMAAADSGSRAVLPQGQTRAPADRAGADAANLLPAAVVWTV